MSGLREVMALLARERIRVALIGAGALAAHGVSRATLDTDFLTLDRRVLDRAVWRELHAPTEIRIGDLEDPLAGIVRVRPPGERPVDLIVGRYRWQERIVSEASPGSFLGVTVPIVDAHGLILLKLYAGGTQDAWDIEQLLAAGDRAALIHEVEARLGDLPAPAAALWGRIVPPPS